VIRGVNQEITLLILQSVPPANNQRSVCLMDDNIHVHDISKVFPSMVCFIDQIRGEDNNGFRCDSELLPFLRRIID
jgi:hypothetical protein